MYLNTKIKILRGDSNFKTGEIYEIKEGQIQNVFKLNNILIPCPHGNERLRNKDDVRILLAPSDIREEVLHSIDPSCNIWDHPFMTGYSSYGIEFEFVED